jgi:hypothetical protein
VGINLEEEGEDMEVEKEVMWNKDWTFKDNLIEIPKKLDLPPSPSHLLLRRNIIHPQTITTLNTPNHMFIRPEDLGYLSNRLLLIIHPLLLRYKFEVLIPQTQSSTTLRIQRTKAQEGMNTREEVVSVEKEKKKSARG